jgi:RNA polymerase sigma-70 factor, ECF subfamily
VHQRSEGDTVTSGLSDAELLSRVADRDVDALRILHDRHAPWIIARLRRRCSNDDDVVADAAQDTFVAVWRSAASWSGSGEPAAWLWGIASRRLIGAQRRRTRWAPVSMPAHGDSADVDDAPARLVDRLQLDAAVNGLSDDLRQVVMATYIDGLTVAEASELLEVPAGTIKTRLMRARRRLRGVLG